MDACFSDIVSYLSGKLLTTSLSQLARADEYTTLFAKCVTRLRLGVR